MGSKLTYTVKGPIASFRSADKAPIESLKIHFLPKQEGSGDPSPQNIRNITGWTGCNVWQGVKNELIPKPGTTTNLGVTWVVDSNGKVTFGGIATSWSSVLVGNVPLTGSKILSAKIYGGTEYVCFNSLYLYDSSNTRVANITTGWEANLEKTIDLSEYDTAVRAEIRVKRRLNNTPMYGCFYVVAGMNGNKDFTKELPLSWSDHGVEYGGYIDPVRGKLIAEFKAHVFDGSERIDEYPGTFTNGIRLTSNVFDDCTSLGNLTISDKAILETTVPSDISRLGIRIGGGQFRFYFYIPDSMFDGEATTNKFKQWLSENGLTVVARLTTPIEYDIDSIALQTYLDYNNFWSDTNDDTEVEYCFADRLLTERKRIMHARNEGQLIFWLSGDDAPVDGAWVERIHNWPFELVFNASYDSNEKLYVFDNYGEAYKPNNQNNDPINLGHHFRLEFDVYYNRLNSPTGYILDIGSLTSADKAIGFKLQSKSSSSTVVPNWKMLGNSSNPFSYNASENAESPYPILSDGNYQHLIGFQEIIPFNDMYDVFRLKINGKIKRFSSLIPKVEYKGPWSSYQNHISIGGGVYNIGDWIRGTTPTSDYTTDIKIREIKIYKYD